MTRDRVKDRVRAIAIHFDSTGDDEGAHSSEDALWADVLREIAAGARDPEGLAAEALGTLELKFARWCA